MKKRDNQMIKQRSKMRYYGIAVFVFITIGILPSTVLAQGPTQPEAMQFEAIDVTDIVNLSTGDFSYAIPILNVPGPAGGYPLSLSYHSGIGPNQPATWVGLGWSLNAGAINRSISGYPDDYKGDIVKTSYEAQSQSSWGINLGLAIGPIGLNMSYDQNTGMVGVNGFVSLSAALGLKRRDFDVGLSGGTNGFSPSASLKSSRAIAGGDYAYGGGISAGQNGIGVDGGLSKVYQGTREVGSIGLISSGASISSNGISGGNLTVGSVGFNTMTQASNGNLRAFSLGGSIPLPTGASINLGFSKWKWTLDETYSEPSYGVLHQTTTAKQERQGQDGYLMPSKDAYNVIAQGISGSFTPVDDYAYILEDGEENDEKGRLKTSGNGYTFSANSTKQFRFLNDNGLNFANVYDTDTDYGNDYRRLDANKFGSKTIVPVLSGSSGKLQGFVITAEDGMVYEFMQPVKNLYQYTETKFDSATTSYKNWNSLGTPYATSWLLTAIKGPDYVDRDADNLATEGDWGYWVSFDYERSATPQIWRTPYSGYATGSTQYTKQLSFGVREIYHLKSIETETHKAVFESSSSFNGRNPYVDFTQYDKNFDAKSRSDTFTFSVTGDFSWVETAASSNDIIVEVVDYFTLTSNELPEDTSSLCFNTIGLRTFDKDDINITYNNATDISTFTIPSVTACTGTYYSESEATILASNFITVNNYTHKKLDSIMVYNKNDLVNELSKTVFEYDYHLRPKTPGSGISAALGGAQDGSLTLNSVSFYGQNDYLASPPYRFTYANGDAPGAGRNPEYHVEDYDLWGSYKYPGAAPTYTSRSFTDHSTPQSKGIADIAASAWALSKITTPTGSNIQVEYESDDFFYINSTNFMSEAEVFEINTSLSSGTSLKLTSTIGPFQLDGFEIIQVVEREVIVDNGPIVPTVTTNYSFVGEYDLIDSPNNTEITASGTPVYKSNTSGTISKTYKYWVAAVPSIVYGGGSRVKSITTQDGTERTKSLYLYTDGKTSSGTTASLPAEYSEVTEAPYPFSELESGDIYRGVFMDHQTAFGRPAPAVIYSKVQVMNVDENDQPINGMTEYEFYTSNDDPYTVDFEDSHAYFVDNSGKYGMPKSVTYFEQYEDASVTKFRPLRRSETLYAFSNDLINHVNVYVDENITDNHVSRPLGVTQQKHISRVEVISGNWITREIEHTYLNVFGTGQTDTEYFYDSATSGTPSSSIVSREKTIGVDAYSGAPIVFVQQSSDSSEAIFQRTYPAWWRYSGMENKNMLTQTTQETSYRASGVDITDDNALMTYSFPTSEIVASSATTWSSHWTGSVWRKNNTYQYVLDNNYVAFPTAELTNTGTVYPAVTSTFPWQMTSNTVSYDEYGHTTETVNEDGTYQSVLYDSDNYSLVKAVAGNAKQTEVKYYDFEESSNSAADAHTGSRSKNISSGSLGSAPTATPTHGGKYKAGLWAKVTSTFTVNGQSFPGSPDWQYVQVKLNPSQSVTISGSGYYDDLTIVPEYGTISYFNYDPDTWKVVAMTGPDHRTAYYDYDDAGRLIGVREQDKNLVQFNQYAYGNEHFISTTQQYPEPNEDTNFTLTALRSGITVSGNYTWDFGDGQAYETTGLTATHNYTQAGEYNVSVTFKDSDNNTRRTVRTIKVGSALEASITISTDIFYGSPVDGELQIEEPDGNGEDYVFVNAFANVEGGVPPFTYKWEKQLANSSTWELLTETGGHLQVGSRFDSTTSGGLVVFTIRLTVTDFNGSSVEILKPIKAIE